MSKRGFTLVELLAASGVFLISAAAFAYLLKTGSFNLDSAQRLTRAVYSLQAQAESLRPLPFESLPSLNGKTFDRGSGKIRVAPALADLLKIELELEWDPSRIPLKIQTLRSKY